MDHDDRDLAERLSRLEASIPAPDDLPVLGAAKRRNRVAVSIAMAPILVLAVVVTAAAGAYVVSNTVRDLPGIENPGQPLAGARMECMSPREAEAFLARHGFVRVDWQIESGTPGVDGRKGHTSSLHQASAPEHGYVVPGSLLDDGSVIMVVDQTDGATAVGHCFGMPMP